MIPALVLCVHCGARFSSAAEAHQHEAQCPHNPDRVGRHALIEQPADSQVYYGAGDRTARPRDVGSQPWVPMVLARDTAGLSTRGLATDGLMGVAFAEMSAAARGFMALGVRG